MAEKQQVKWRATRDGGLPIASSCGEGELMAVTGLVFAQRGAKARAPWGGGEIAGKMDWEVVD